MRAEIREVWKSAFKGVSRAFHFPDVIMGVKTLPRDMQHICMGFAGDLILTRDGGAA